MVVLVVLLVVLVVGLVVVVVALVVVVVVVMVVVALVVLARQSHAGSAIKRLLDASKKLGRRGIVPCAC